jgi:asparagine synthase (glutamine-hydrolysing)
MALSGGLDSSITLSCLADLHPQTRTSCLTQFVHGTDSDERPFARLAAAWAHCDLIEHSREDVPDLRTAQYRERLAWSPGLRIPSVDRIEADHALRVGATAIFYGHGGDEIHCRNGFTRYVCDFIRANGFRRGLGELLLNAAFFEGITVWEVLARATYGAFRARRMDPMKELTRDIWETSLLHADVLSDLIARPNATTPYEDPGITLSPGRAWQLSLLCAQRNFASPFDQHGDPVRVSPLLSQPLIELCLRIPTWYQIADRRDRSLARRAFADDIAPDVRDRRDKGGAESVAAAIVERNRPFLREMLLDGVVARSGILNSARVEAALSESLSDIEVPSAPVFSAVGAEIWARAWTYPVRARNQPSTRNERPSEGNSSSPYRLT